MGKKLNLIGYDENIVIISYIKPQFNSLNYNEILVNSIFDTYLINNVKKNDKEGNISENYKRFYGKNPLDPTGPLMLGKIILRNRINQKILCVF